ncbi:hypothetical protein DFR52_102508 [Hoeflea marina]|uniref:Antibiotic biosynthesis monooxygenase n=1 Tax=Hoeflea marina TaxID=274592 RepID=A0A317PSH2_9HYPH|nr:antibiotic biosynthesis monooxygenase [Hoeflea marina]PWW01844.1 hypothetical protein DFR52_102508 [Hoeflea marina]
MPESTLADPVPADTAGPVLRIDRFDVPAAARDAFLDRVGRTHAVLRAQPGFVLDRIVERPLGEGASRVITIVEWSGPEAVGGAVEAVKRMHAGDGFSAAGFIAASGIIADIGLYRPAA